MGLTFSNGVVQTNRYDPAGRLLERTYTAGETLLGRYEYQLNELGQTVFITETVLTPELIETIETYVAQNGVLNLALSNGVLTPTAELPISLPSGEYTVWAHAWDEGSTSPTTTLPLALDNGSTVLTNTLANFPTSGWAWTTGGSTTLTADGAYTLTAGLVGDGVQADRLVFADNSLYDPNVSQPELTGPTLITQTIPSELVTQTIALSYDGLNRVTEAEYNGAYTSIFGYEYNALGSRLTYTEGVTVTTYSYNAADYLLQSVTGNVTTTYSWNAAGQLITTTVAGQPTTLYTYDQRGNLTVAVTNGLTTTFVYNGHNQRLQLSVNGQPTTYLLDYARGGNRVLQETSALETKFYLYGDTCLAELVETDDPERPEQRYYLYDGSQTVRQTVNEQAEPTYAWTFSPEGAVLLGEKGPVSHLSCVGDAVYDWSTGLIFKGGKYYDPRSDLWLTFGSPAIVWAVNRLGGKPDKRKDKKQDKRFFWLLFLLLVLFVLVGCSSKDMPISELNCQEEFSVFRGEKYQLNDIPLIDEDKTYNSVIRQSTVKIVYYTSVDGAMSSQGGEMGLGTVVGDGTEIITHAHIKNPEQYSYIKIRSSASGMFDNFHISEVSGWYTPNPNFETLRLKIPSIIRGTTPAIEGNPNDLKEGIVINTPYRTNPGNTETDHMIDVMTTKVYCTGRPCKESFEKTYPNLKSSDLIDFAFAYNIDRKIKEGDSGGGIFIQGKLVGHNYATSIRNMGNEDESASIWITPHISP